MLRRYVDTAIVAIVVVWIGICTLQSLISFVNSHLLWFGIAGALVVVGFILYRRYRVW